MTSQSNPSQPRQFLRPEKPFAASPETSFQSSCSNMQQDQEGQADQTSPIHNPPESGEQRPAAFSALKKPGVGQFHPLTGKHSVPQMPSLAGDQNMSMATDKQLAPPFQPWLSGKQIVPSSSQTSLYAPQSPSMSGKVPLSAFTLPTTDKQVASRPPSPLDGSQSLDTPPALVARSLPFVTGALPHNSVSMPLPDTVSQPLSSTWPPQTALPARRRLPIFKLVMSILLVVVLVAGFLQRDFVFSTVRQAAQALTSVTSTLSGPALNSFTNNKEISPLIFGTNMALFHDNDEDMLNSAQTRRLLKEVGVRLIRMPTRATLRPETMLAAARAIKEVGAVPLVILHGPEFTAGPLLENDKRVLTLLSSVFGNEPVYYEFGNESDLNGIPVEQYVEHWNQVIPALKLLSPTARFIGPDTYQFTRRYLKTFLQHARPLPDGVSWHEYACGVSWSIDSCLAGVDAWPIHFAQARLAMQEAIGKTLPIWITEWNYVSDQMIKGGKPINDGKYDNPTFMRTWMSKALKTFIDNRIFAAAQYYATNPPMPLITQEKIGVEGTVFQQSYKSIMVDGKTPPQAFYKGPPPPTFSANPYYSFERPGSSGWTADGTGITEPSSTTAKALHGTHALQFTLKNEKEEDMPLIQVSANLLPAPIKPGQMVSAYIYVANKDALVDAKIFIADPLRSWHFVNSVTLTPGAWNKVWYALPLDYKNDVGQLGIQFFTARPGVGSVVYIDAIEWH